MDDSLTAGILTLADHSPVKLLTLSLKCDRLFSSTSDCSVKLQAKG